MPDEPAGESTAWYATFWDFCVAYLNKRFDGNWCLSPEQSLLLHTGNRTVPAQLLVRTPKGGNKVTALPHNTWLLDVRASMPEEKDIVEIDGIRLCALPTALITCTATFYRQHLIEVCAALAMIKDASDILERLLEGGHSTIAGRLERFEILGGNVLLTILLKPCVQQISMYVKMIFLNMLALLNFLHEKFHLM